MSFIHPLADVATSSLGEGTRIEDDVFIGPNVTFTNDPYPRSKKYPEQFSGIAIKRKASVGVNATLLPGITIGEYAMVGAGAVVHQECTRTCCCDGQSCKKLFDKP